MNRNYLWIFGILFLIMFAIVLIKPDWVRGSDEPVPFADVNAEQASDPESRKCVYFWNVTGLAHITRILDSTSAGPYPVIPILVDVDFYPVNQTVATEGLASEITILSRVQVPRPYMIGQWDTQQPPRITLVRRECGYLPPKPDPAPATEN